MAIKGRAEIIIEGDDQYTTVTTSTDTDTGIKLAVSVAANQTLAVAFNKARDDLAPLASGPLKHRFIVVTTDVS